MTTMTFAEKQRRDRIACEVIQHGQKIAAVALRHGVSASTVRRYMDEYTARATQPKTIDRAWFLEIELHVGNDTRHLCHVFFADSKPEAEAYAASYRPDYRGNDNPSYELQVKSGPWRLANNFDMLQEY